MDIYIYVGLLLIIVVLFLIWDGRRRYKKKLRLRERINLEKMIDYKDFSSENDSHNPSFYHDNQVAGYPAEAVDENRSTKFSENINKYFNTGLNLFNATKYSDSIKYFDKVIVVHPSEPSSYFYRGLAHNKLGMFKEAIDDFTDAILYKLNNPKNILSKGDCLVKTW